MCRIDEYGGRVKTSTGSAPRVASAVARRRSAAAARTHHRSATSSAAAEHSGAAACAAISATPNAPNDCERAGWADADVNG